VWLVGSLNAADWAHAWPLAVAVAVLAPALLALGRRIDALAFGDDAARALGLRVERTRLLALGLAVVLTAAAVAAAGPIGFVAFVAPHIARRLARPASAAGLLLVSAATGAALVVLADLVGRLASSPTEIPVGIVTSVLAAPYFLYLLRT
jgi:ABC-type Fe3+-siderophore transport system permease subunit